MAADLPSGVNCAISEPSMYFNAVHYDSSSCVDENGDLRPQAALPVLVCVQYDALWLRYLNLLGIYV